jgi:hypothetical protein
MERAGVVHGDLGIPARIRVDDLAGPGEARVLAHREMDLPGGARALVAPGDGEAVLGRGQLEAGPERIAAIACTHVGDGSEGDAVGVEAAVANLGRGGVAAVGRGEIGPGDVRAAERIDADLGRDVGVPVGHGGDVEGIAPGAAVGGVGHADAAGLHPDEVGARVRADGDRPEAPGALVDAERPGRLPGLAAVGAARGVECARGGAEDVEDGAVREDAEVVADVLARLGEAGGRGKENGIGPGEVIAGGRLAGRRVAGRRVGGRGVGGRGVGGRRVAGRRVTGRRVAVRGVGATVAGRVGVDRARHVAGAGHLERLLGGTAARHGCGEEGREMDRSPVSATLRLDEQHGVSRVGAVVLVFSE